MRFAELPGYLRGLQARAGLAVIPASNAMAGAFRDRVKNVTLVKSGRHDRGTRTPARPGAPPAMESGALARSVLQTVVASTPVVARSQVAATIFYASVQEYGGEMHGNPFMVFNYGGPYRARRVVVPERPFMRPTVIWMMGDGSLWGAGAWAFYAAMWG